MGLTAIDSTVIGRLSGGKVLVARNDTSGEESAISRLKERDREVRAHEAAHLSDPRLVTVQSPVFIYQIGPDGKPYAVGGSVAVMTPRAETRSEALDNAFALRKSAASDEPSPQDAAAGIAAYSMINESLSIDTENSLFNEKA